VKEQHSILIAGVGGQGIVFASTVLAQALYKQGYYVSQLQSYGAEVRGSAVIAWVVYSNNPITCPFVNRYEIMIILHQDGYKQCIKKGFKADYIIVDQDLVPNPPSKSIILPINREAEKNGCRASVNIVALGVLSKLGYVNEISLKEVLSTMKNSEMNLKALKIGLNLINILNTI